MSDTELAEKPKKKNKFLLIDLPNYTYTNGLACPDCYKPVTRNKKDGRCYDCLRDKKVLPVNYIRPPKKKEEEDEDL